MSKLKAIPSKEILDNLFLYERDTGKLFWRINRSNNAKTGCEAGSLDGKGYRFVRISKQPYRTHRIIWKIVTGVDPDNHIDHINGNKLDNKFENLRVVSHGQNLKNCKRRVDNTSGVTGISWNPRRNVWRSYINLDGKMKELGNFKNKQDAIMCREIFSRKHNFHTNHGRIENV